MVLFTVAEFKAHEGIIGSSLDALIVQLELRATAHFERLLHRKLDGAGSFTEDYSGQGQRDLVLRYSPVVAITSISIDSNRVFTSPITASDYVLDPEAAILTRVEASTLPVQFRAGPVWPCGDYNIRAIYTAGYTTAPEDLKEAAILWAAARLARQGLIGVQSETIGSHSISMFAGKTAGEAEVAALTAPYRSYPSLGPVRDAS